MEESIPKEVIIKELGCGRSTLEKWINRYKTEGAESLKNRHKRTEKENPSWEIIDEYIDDGYTGSNLDRPAIKRLISDAKEHKFDVVVSYKVDRVSRSLKDFHHFYEILKQHNVQYASAAESFDTSKEIGKLFLNIILSFAEYERGINSDRVRDKNLQRAKKGYWLNGQPPIGYDYNKDTKSVIINYAEAKLIRTIFNRANRDKTNHTLANVVKWLNAHGYKTKQRIHTIRKGPDKGKAVNRGSKNFNIKFLSKVLQNKAYIGTIVYNDKKSGKHYEFPGKHQPILKGKRGKDLFIRVNNRLFKKRKKNKSEGEYTSADKHILLLKSIIKCGHCKCSMTPSSKTKKEKLYLYYRCYKHDSTPIKKNSNCPTKQLNARLIEQSIIDTIILSGKNKKILNAILNKSQHHENKNTKPIQDKITTFMRQKKAHQKKIDNLISALEAGKANKSITRKITEYESMIDILNNDINTPQIKVRQILNKVTDAKAITRLLDKFPDTIKKLPLQEQKNYFNSF